MSKAKWARPGSTSAPRLPAADPLVFVKRKAANSAPNTSATVDRQAGSPSARRSSRQSPTTNDVSATTPRSKTASARSAQEDSAILRKKATTCSRVASNGGSPKDASAMIGTKTRTMPTSPAAPVARAMVVHGSRCDTCSVWPRPVTRMGETIGKPRSSAQGSGFSATDNFTRFTYTFWHGSLPSSGVVPITSRSGYHARWCTRVPVVPRQ
jgi:hypothetical protein